MPGVCMLESQGGIAPIQVNSGRNYDLVLDAG